MNDVVTLTAGDPNQPRVSPASINAQQTEAEDSIRKRFCSTIDKASNLLDFLIDEGYRYKIPDKIIDEVEAARECLKQAGAPIAEERAKLTEAYRDLVNISRTSVTFDKMPPTCFWTKRSPWPWSLIITMIFAIFGTYLLVRVYGHHWLFLSPVAALLAGWLVWGFYVFTGVVTNRKLNQIIIFCYIFTIIALLGSLFPWFAPYPFLNAAENAPVRLLQGCAVGSDIPKDIKCDDQNFQWLLNIGGLATAQSGTGTEAAKKAEAASPAPGTVASPLAVAPEAAKVQGEAGKTPATAGGATKPAKGKADAGGEPKAPPPVAGTVAPSGAGTEATKTRGEVGKTPAAAGGATSPGAGKATVEGAMAASQVRSEAALHYQIRGGVVVPLYIIVLAFFGGAVSMTRRVPEIQRRAMDQQDPFDNVEARENLVFQMMQMATAPLIAITAFYILKPDTVTTSVVLAFASGFASEPILLAIRNQVDKLTPAAPTVPKVVSVRVNPTTATLKYEEARQFTAEVLGAANSEVVWTVDPPGNNSGTISESGNYVAPNVDKTVTITARSAADRTKFGSAQVKIVSAAQIEPSTVKVLVTPKTAPAVGPGQTQQFTANVSGSANREVTWSHKPDFGTIDQNGKYAAPSPVTEQKTVTVIAQSKADSTKSDSATITVHP